MMDFTKSLNTKLIKKVKESKNVLGQRVKPTLNNGQRTLYHYGFEGTDCVIDLTQYVPDGNQYLGASIRVDVASINDDDESQDAFEANRGC